MLAQNLPEARMTPRLPLQVLTNKRIKHELTPAKLLSLRDLKSGSNLDNALISSYETILCEECEAEKERALTIEKALLDVDTQNNLLEREVSGLELYLEDLLAGLNDKKKRIRQLRSTLRDL